MRPSGSGLFSTAGVFTCAVSLCAPPAAPVSPPAQPEAAGALQASVAQRLTPAPEALPARAVTVEQLDKLLAASRGESDREVAQQLSGLALTERLSSKMLSSWTPNVHGKKSRQALVALADVSAFLAPPQAEIPAIATPNLIAQRHILSLADDYLHKTIRKLPDFSAMRTVVSYEETPEYGEIHYQPLHVADAYRERVLYRDGHEVVNAKVSKSKKPGPEDRYLITRGTFGPLLGWVTDAMAVPDALAWTRWEQGASGLVAVFRYAVPMERSHFQIKGCCLPNGDGVSAFTKTTGYSGEVAIDPESGAIFRLELKADLKSLPPLARSDIMIEYGPVEIGAKSYICPVRSASLWRGRSVIAVPGSQGRLVIMGPYITALNDVTFDGYHMFRSESRVLPGFKRAQEETVPDAAGSATRPRPQ